MWAIRDEWRHSSRIPRSGRIREYAWRPVAAAPAGPAPNSLRPALLERATHRPPDALESGWVVTRTDDHPVPAEPVLGVLNSPRELNPIADLG